jgi:hypothetical protein
MKRLILPFVFIGILLGCSDDSSDEVIVPVINPEEEEKVEELPAEVTFPVDGEPYTVNLAQIPVLAYYIATNEDVDETINQFSGTTIASTEHFDLIVMSYACRNTKGKCSYILIKDTGKEQQMIPLADLATYASYALSPDEQYMVIQFNRGDTESFFLSRLLAIDLDKMEIKLLENDELTKDVLHYNFPIYSMNWLNNDEIEIELPQFTEDPLNHNFNFSTERQFLQFYIDK